MLGGQETGSFSFTFLTNLSAHFIRVSLVILMQEIWLPLHMKYSYICQKLFPIRSFVQEIQYYLHTQGLPMFSGTLILLHRQYGYYFP